MCMYVDAPPAWQRWLDQTLASAAGQSIYRNHPHLCMMCILDLSILRRCPSVGRVFVLHVKEAGDLPQLLSRMITIDLFPFLKDTHQLYIRYLADFPSSYHTINWSFIDPTKKGSFIDPSLKRKSFRDLRVLCVKKRKFLSKAELHEGLQLQFSTLIFLHFNFFWKKYRYACRHNVYICKSTGRNMLNEGCAKI